MTKTQLWIYGGGALMVLIIGYLIIKKGGAFGFALAKGVVETTVGATVGTVVGVGEIVGIPQTDSQKCIACQKIKDIWGASKFCTLIEFLTWSNKSVNTSTADVMPIGTNPTVGIQKPIMMKIQ